MTQSGQTSETVPELSSDRSMALWRLHHSQLCRRPRRQDWTLNLSAFSCAENFTCPFLCRCGPADVAANMISLTTIVLRVPVVGVLVKKGATHWSVPLHRCAVKLESTCFCKCPCGRLGFGRSQQSGWPAIAATISRLPEPEQLTMTERSWLMHVGEKNEHILNCQVKEDELVWWSPVANGCFGRRLSPILPIHLVKTGAYVRKWSAVLACSAARAFTASRGRRSISA